MCCSVCTLCLHKYGYISRILIYCLENIACEVLPWSTHFSGSRKLANLRHSLLENSLCLRLLKLCRFNKFVSRCFFSVFTAVLDVYFPGHAFGTSLYLLEVKNSNKKRNHEERCGWGKEKQRNNIGVAAEAED